MATLTVQLPDVDDDMPLVLLTAGPSDTSDPPQLLCVRDAILVHEGNSADVYKGTLMCDGEEKNEVVLKVVFGGSAEDLRCLEVEYGFYRKLESVQGSAIPVCYGLFRAPHESVACLMLELWGSRLDCYRFRDLDIDLRLDIVDCLIAIHNAGVQHNDIEPRNIVVKDGVPRIIDFEDASDHDCRCTTVIYEGAFRPNEYDFGCSELYHYTRKACIWRPGHFMVAGIAVPEHRAKSLEEIEEFVRGRDVMCTQEFLRGEAENALKLAAIIKEYGGYRPRAETLAKRGILH